MVKPILDAQQSIAPAVADGRLDAPACRRNAEPILSVLRELLSEKRGNVIEVGSGTGQHAVQFAPAFPNLTWWPTDPDPAHRRSIDAWRAYQSAPNVMPAVDLDAAGNWHLDEPGRPPSHDIAAILCVNVLHITPWPLTLRLVGQAGALLRGAGCLIVYGPFMQNGMHNAASNARFDETLRRHDPRWGVRDITDIAHAAGRHGLELANEVAMPANNRILVLMRPDRG